MNFGPGYGVNYDTGAGTASFGPQHGLPSASNDTVAEPTTDNYSHLFESPTIVANNPPANAFHQQSSSVGFAVDSSAAHDISNAAQIVVQAAGQGQYPCPACGKQFPRKCDLNKHFKTHSRRFKCEYPTCTYSEQGFPTQKELERHINDKHNPNRKVFACPYQSCPYKSPRESNLKAHMEKAHNYHYIRTRSRRSYRCPFEGCSACMNEEDTRQRHGQHAQVQSAMTSPMYPRYTRGDFILYPEMQNPNMLAYSQPQAGVLGQGGTQQPPATPDSYLPWTSPATRLQNVENNIQRVDDTIRPEQQHGVLMSPFPLDPQLFQAPMASTPVTPTYTPTATEQPSTIFAAPAYARVAASRPMPAMPVKVPWTGSLDHMEAKGQIDMAARPAQPSKPAYYPGAAEAQQGPAQGYEQLAASPEQPALKLEESDNDESSHDEDEPPQKKPKASHGDEADDDKVPCPFREHDPVHFSRDNNEKFSPCHSKHESIASLVRHLKRPAHRLRSDRKYISSFDVDDDGQRYPRAGLCKRCWKPFTDGQLFDEHLGQTCTKSSRGKREKYNLLRDTFVTGAARPVSNSLEVPSPATGWQATAAATADESEAAENELLPQQTTDTIHVGAAARNATPSAGAEIKEKRFQDLEQKLLALTQRVAVLEEERQHNGSTIVIPDAGLHLPRQFGGLTAAEAAASLVAHTASSTPRASIISSVIPSQPGPPAAATAGGDEPSSSRHYRPQRRQSIVLYGPSASSSSLSSSRLLQRGDLVGGMDSVQIDVEPEDFFTEAARTLSGLSSSSDRSSVVRHVPPPTLDSGPAARECSRGGGGGGGVSGQAVASGPGAQQRKRRRAAGAGAGAGAAKTTPSPRRQKVAPSLTDSGYVSRWRNAGTTVNDDDDDDDDDDGGDDRMSDVDEEKGDDEEDGGEDGGENENENDVDESAGHEARQDEGEYRLSQSDFHGTTLMSPDQVASMFQ
ncbi:uncharacterized protein E0L32_000999 [Thyridium curvatum]|uniref:C2H2-type domain-containing protein n=1 Tax=Thyridium curvatum TaxID=1093900 RepID=A0A507B282_9PEZI|nr:uncharacterized protein E0L32_000999 [Thyridium curvatum]TPX11181.1 hypothetical protein E0L32_000999 [Thyridium curvatum]